MEKTKKIAIVFVKDQDATTIITYDYYEKCENSSSFIFYGYLENNFTEIIANVPFNYLIIFK